MIKCRARCHARTMRLFERLGVVMVLAVCSAMLGQARESRTWRAVSSTARAITGDVVLSEEKISISYVGYPIAQIRALSVDEKRDLFHAENGAGGSGSVYRLNVPAAKTFLRKNSLCGGEDTQWMATFVAGKTLQLAFFSGATVPVLTGEALANSTDLCGTFTYGR